MELYRFRILKIVIIGSFKGAKQAEKDETEAIKTTPPSQYVTTAIFLSILY